MNVRLVYETWADTNHFFVICFYKGTDENFLLVTAIDSRKISFDACTLEKTAR